MDEHLKLTSVDNKGHFNLATNVTHYDVDQIYQTKIAGVPLWYYTGVCVVLASLGINGVLLNGLVIRGFVISPSIRTPYNAIVLNLAVAEFLLATFGVTLDVQSLVQNGWVHGKNICVTTGALVTTSGFVSMLTLCVLSICRYNSIFRFGNVTENVSSFKRAVTIICVIWMYSFALSLPPLFGWGRYVPEISGLACAPDWHSANVSKTYVMYMLIFGFFIPTTITIIASLLTCVEAFTFKSKVERRSTFKKYKRNLHLLLMMNVSYLICWSPYALVCITHTFFSKTIIGPMLSMIPTVAVKISVCINPLLYIAYNPQFHGKFNLNVMHSKRRNRKMLRRTVLQKQNREANVRTNKDVIESNNIQPLRTLLKTSVVLQVARGKSTGKKDNKNGSNLII